MFTRFLDYGNAVSGRGKKDSENIEEGIKIKKICINEFLMDIHNLPEIMTSSFEEGGNFA